MKRAIQYRRVSTKVQEQDGYSLPTQQLENEAYAAQNNLKIIADYWDDSTGTNLDRPGLQGALAYLESGQAQALIIFDTDRLTRNSADYVWLRERLSQLNIELHYATRGQVLLDDFGHQIYEDINGRFGQHERTKILERMKRGKLAAVKDGKVFVGGRAPYGYDAVANQLVINPTEAEVIRLIYSLFVEDQYAIWRIVRHLSKAKIPTSADYKDLTLEKQQDYGTWSKASVHRILSSETYAGVWYYAGIPVSVPAIIDRQTWEAAQRQLKTNRQKASRNSKHDYLLQKRVTCACGSPFYVVTRVGRPGQPIYYYCANTRRKFQPHEPGCSMPYFMGKILEEAIWQWIKRLLSDREFLTGLIEQYLAEQEQQQGTTLRDLDSTRNKIEAKKGQMKKLAREFVSTAMASEVYQELNSEFAQELDELQLEEGKLIAAIGGQAAGRKQVMKLTEIMREFQAGLQLYDDEPFEIRRGWVEALDINLQLEISEAGKRLAHLTCVLGTDTVPIEDRLQPGPGYNDYIILSYTLELPVMVARI